MWFEIVGRGLGVAATLRGRVAKRMKTALGRFQSRIGRVTIRLIDVNGPRGGVDKRCRIVAEVVGQAPTVVEETDWDLNALIDRSADRLGYTIRRKLGRERTARRSRRNDLAM